MALSQSDLQTRIDALRKARDSGVLMIRHGDEHTTFRSLSEMNTILAQLEAELDDLQGTKKSKVRYVSQNTKGYGGGSFEGFD